MSINYFIDRHAVQPADAIVMNKKFFGMVDHYVIYLGIYNRQHTFVANYTKGVKVISNSELNKFLEYLEPRDIDRFPGTENERPAAIKRAISRINEKAYDYLANNCEHFKNWVHRGIHKSEQVENLKAGVAVGVGAAAFIGLLALILNKDEE